MTKGGFTKRCGGCKKFAPDSKGYMGCAGPTGWQIQVYVNATMRACESYRPATFIPANNGSAGNA